jgi:hypothetical protein
LADELGALPVVAQVSLVLGLLAGLALSALVAERATVPLLRLLEGTGPPAGHGGCAIGS